jgi:DNA-directed RNA polymerase specialized sigma24 family protein
MATSGSLINAISSYVDQTGRRLSGIRAYGRWCRAQPLLARYPCLADALRACRYGAPEVQDALLGALVTVAVEDPLGNLAVIAALSRRLGGVVAAWRRGGASGSDIAVLEADLVSECWAAVAVLAAGVASGEALPPKLAFAIVDRAHAAVRAPRRRELRAAGRQVRLQGELPHLAKEDKAPAAEELAREIGAAVRAGRLSAAAARPVFLTRALGYSTAEAAQYLGRSPAVLRAQRSRAERALVRADGH